MEDSVLPASGAPALRNLGFRIYASAQCASFQGMLIDRGDRVLRGRVSGISLLLYPYVFIAGLNEHNTIVFIELAT
jgi:hypothetical protein